MRPHRAPWLAPVAALLLASVAPSMVHADHCGAAATVSPASGRPGTTFVFRTDLGSSVDLRVYQGESLVIDVFLETDGPIRFEIPAEAGSVGHWRVRAEVRGQPGCAAEATFTVIGTPDTSTASGPASPPTSSVLLVLVAGLAAFGLLIRRFRGGVR